MNSPEPLYDSFLRFAKSWVLLPLFAYFFAIPALGPGSLFVPMVIARAPLGIISFFDKVTLDDNQHQMAIRLIHLVFWSLFVTGLSGRFSLPLWVLRTIWFLLVISLIMSVAGCERAFGSGLRSEGNWH